eukprot:SAG11_NODE_15013_length_591_cov_1.441057_1_plen_47_part_10
MAQRGPFRGIAGGNKPAEMRSVPPARYLYDSNVARRDAVSDATGEIF